MREERFELPNPKDLVYSQAQLATVAVRACFRSSTALRSRMQSIRCRRPRLRREESLNARPYGRCRAHMRRRSTWLSQGWLPPRLRFGPLRLTSRHSHPKVILTLVVLSTVEFAPISARWAWMGRERVSYGHVTVSPVLLASGSPTTTATF